MTMAMPERCKCGSGEHWFVCSCRKNKKQPHEILEELANRGYAPSLYYDDDGRWIVTDAGFNPLDGVGQYSIFVESTDLWSDNIVDAVNRYLANTGEEV